MNRSAHIQIVGWNHRAVLAPCLRSCLSQTARVPVLYVDNASADGSAAFVRETFPWVRVRVNAENRGYAGGHNDGLRIMRGTDIAILLNPDVVLDPAFVEEILTPFDDDRVGAVAPLLVRRDAGSADGETLAVDAYGIELLPGLRAVNRFEGRPLSSLVLHSSRVGSPWGFTGAAVALRRSALADVAEDGDVFDEDLHSYREDVDLSWRLRHRAWRIAGAPRARAFHERSARAGEPKSPWVARLSWRNYFLVLVKDVPVRTMLAHAIPLLVEGGGRTLAALVTPALWPAWGDLVRLLPRFLRKRRRVL